MTTPPPILAASSSAAVVIGRNEGERLRVCLTSVLAQCPRVIYVDSGSSDGSVALARSLGAEVCELETGRPFTAARGRNAGLEKLTASGDVPTYVLFVDGDCELNLNFVPTAARELDANPQLAAVTGRLRERFPENSIYNKLCDIEWNMPAGDITWCGGNAMMRVSALVEAGGFDAAMIAGEEPELCFRLREKGWKLRRIDFEMMLHDAAMTRFGQWWKRARRTGYAFALGYHMHGKSPEQYCRKETRRIWIWGVGLPAVALLLAPFTNLLSLLLVPLGLAVLFLKLLPWVATLELHSHDARNYAFFIALAKLPEAQGLVAFHYHRKRKKQGAIIEYKQPAAPPPALKPVPAE